MLDYKYFYDTDLHLNSEGADLRTRQLIDDLKRWRESNEDATMEKDQYADIMADNQLAHITDFNGYVDALKEGRKRYTVIVAAQNVNDNALKSVLKPILAALEHGDINIEPKEIIEETAFQTMIIERGKTVCLDTGNPNGIRQGILELGLNYTISGGSNGSIVLNGQEYSRMVNGLNLVIYSNETRRIIDEAALVSDDGITVQIIRD